MTLITYVFAAIAEIAGCFAIWAIVRNGASAMWLVPGIASLVLFGWLLTKVDVAFAGRAYAVTAAFILPLHWRGYGLSKGVRRIAGTSPAR